MLAVLWHIRVGTLVAYTQGMQKLAMNNNKQDLLTTWLKGVNNQLALQRKQTQTANGSKRSRARARREAQALFKEYYRNLAADV